MEPTHPLKALLQLQLASDPHAVLHLPYVLTSLTPEYFLPSPHLPKWTMRISSLLHSKDSGSRWAGLCLAHKTSMFSKTTMIECAHGWLGVALPMLSKNEPIPTLKGAVRLIRYILTAAMDVPEFQRQVATPNVQKFTTALIGLAEKHVDLEFKILLLTTLTRIIPLYPTPHRASHTALSNLSLRFLNGSVPGSTNGTLLEAASRLYSVLHFTGGKVGATNLWKKSVDETLAFAWRAFLGLRSTFPNEGRNPLHHAAASSDDPLISIPLNLDRLQCCIVVLCDLLGSTTHRSVQVPLGALIDFSTALLSCTSEEEEKGGYADPAMRAMEISAIPAIWKFSCDLIVCLAKCARHHLTPNLTKLVSYLTFHLEQKMMSSQRLSFLQTLQVVLSNCHQLHSPLTPTRLAKAVLPLLSTVLATQPEVQHVDNTGPSSNKGKKGRKRARGYEGDEVFKLSKEVICPTVDDGKVVLAALDVMTLVLRNSNLAPVVHSISSRVLLSMLHALPQMLPTSLSPDPTLHGRLVGEVQTISAELGSGTTSAMSKSLGLVIGAVLAEESNDVSYSNVRYFDILLHPRVPPLVRSLPHVESLFLFRAEESQEEIDARESLGLEIMDQNPLLLNQDMTMEEQPSLPQPNSESTSSVIPPPVKALADHLPLPALPGATDGNQKPSGSVTSTSTPPLTPGPPLSSTAGTLRPVVQSQTVVPFVEDEEDEEIPAIDMDSDSD